jgi:signal transduction histidine kinase
MKILEKARQFIDQLSISNQFIIFYYLVITTVLLVGGGITFLGLNVQNDSHLDRIVRTHLAMAEQLLVQKQEDLALENAAFFDTVQSTNPPEPLSALLDRLPQELGVSAYWLVDEALEVRRQGENPGTAIPLEIKEMASDVLKGNALGFLEIPERVANQKSYFYYCSGVRLQDPKTAQPYALIMQQPIDPEPMLKVVGASEKGVVVSLYRAVVQPETFLWSNLPETPVRGMPPIWDRLGFYHYVSKALFKTQFTDNETINGLMYKTGFVPLKEWGGFSRALLTVSVPLDDFQRSRMFRSFFIRLFGHGSQVCLLLVIVYFGFRFREKFILPIERLSSISQKVAYGDLTVRAETDQPSHEIRGTMQNFNRMVEMLQEKEELRRNFIANLTHDFRTPLIAQERALELLMEEFSQSDLKELAPLSNGLLENNRHLLKMVNQLLEMYKYEAGQIEINREPVDLPHLVQQCLDQLEPLARKQNITLEAQFDPALTRQPLDKDALKRVLVNLLGNAVENIPKGSRIVVKVTPLPPNPGDSSEDGGAEIQVQDNGQGIPPEVLHRIFDRYYSGNDKRRKIGSGLGLYISKLLIEAHEGTLTVESEVGAYTTFRIQLPRV